MLRTAATLIALALTASSAQAQVILVTERSHLEAIAASALNGDRSLDERCLAIGCELLRATAATLAPAKEPESCEIEGERRAFRVTRLVLDDPTDANNVPVTKLIGALNLLVSATGVEVSNADLLSLVFDLAGWASRLALAGQIKFYGGRVSADLAWEQCTDGVWLDRAVSDLALSPPVGLRHQHGTVALRRAEEAAASVMGVYWNGPAIAGLFDDDHTATDDDVLTAIAAAAYKALPAQ